MSARVLVVDDILPNVKLLEAKLMSEYYDVLNATSGAEALEKVEKESPDIVLLDIMMPGMDGFEVCARIKQNPAVAHIPVVMVTALTDTQDKVRGLEAGADDFLSKPINDTALMARVRSLVRLKMTLDEWRARESTANQLGVVEQTSDAMRESVESAQILVIEDKDFEQRKIEETLSVDNDNIIIVDNGAAAMEKVGQMDIDLFIVSLTLENEDGLRLCSHLKSNEKTRSVPILMMAEEEDMGRIVHGLDIGVHDYILKPVDRNELLARTRTQVRRKRFQERLRSSFEVSLSMALTDSLTGLHNRRYLDVHLEKLMENNKNSQKDLAVLLLDIDHFKNVNDTHGHGVGDEVLIEFSKRLQASTRSFDLVVRQGGEEFVVILPDVLDHRAHMVAERLRRAIANTPFKCSAEGGQINITTSIGGVVIRKNVHPVPAVIARADKALYEAKETGRNRVIFEGVGWINPEDFEPRKRPTIK